MGISRLVNTSCACPSVCLSVCLQPQPRLASTSQLLALALRASGHPFGGKHGEPEPPALPCPPCCFPSLVAAHLENSRSCRTKNKNKPKPKRLKKKVLSALFEAKPKHLGFSPELATFVILLGVFSSTLH